MRVLDNSKELFVRINDSLSVFNDENYIRVYDGDKECFRKPTNVFAQRPSAVFEDIKDCLEIEVQDGIQNDK